MNDIDNSEMAMAMLNGLPELYDPLISALDAIYGESSSLDFDIVKSRAIQEEQRIQIRTCQASLRAEESALLSRNYLRACEYCKKPGHTENKCWKKHPHLKPRRRSNALLGEHQSVEDDSVVCLIEDHQEYEA